VFATSGGVIIFHWVLGNVLTTPGEGDIITMGSITGTNLNATNVSVTDSISCATLNAENISVRPNINITASFGKVVLGYLDGKYQSAGFAHINYNTPREYALLQTNDGHTYLNTSTDLHFKLLNEDKMIIKRQTGHVGIGTVTPRVSLDVANAVNIHSWGTSFNQDNNWVEGGAIHGSARVFKNHPVSIMGSGILSWNGFFSASDSRFKTNIQDIDDSGALDLLRKIKPKTYEYIDKVDKGSDTVYGFIAQDISEVFPNCVSIQKEKIPNIYENCIKVDNVITLSNKITHMLEKDENGMLYKTLLVYHSDNKTIELVIKSIIDDKHIEIEPTDELGTNGQLFIYGQIVDNFNTIDKNYIFTIATAALQEVDRQLQAEKRKTATLEARMLLLEARINKLDGNGSLI